MSAIKAHVVVDASVAVKWFLDEAGSTEALRLLDGTYSLSAPDLVCGEVGNALWKRVGREEMTVNEAEVVLDGLSAIPWLVHPTASLVHAAFGIAVRTGCTVYDGLYVALAVELECLLVTADRRLIGQVSQTPLAAHLLWLQQVR